VLHLLFCYSEFYPEDILLGTFPKELLEGLKLSFFDYAATHYHGGTLVYGLLTVPFFVLFGKTVFALRLPTVLFQYGAFITWYCFMKRFFGKRPALYAALLYLFCPPWLTLFGMFANGSHTESLFFTALGVYFLYRLIYEKDHYPRHAVLLGLICGFGSYFTYGILVSTFSFLLFWFYEDRRLFRKKEFFLFVLSFPVGFSPWLVYNFLYQFHGIDVVKQGFVYPYGQLLSIVPFRFLKLATFKVLAMLSFNYRSGASYHPSITLLNLFYYVALLSAYFFLYRTRRNDRKVLFLFLFPLVYVGVASVSQIGIGTYYCPYFVPLFPFFFATLALGLSRLGTLSRNLKRLSIGLLVVLLAMGLKGELNLLSLKEFGLALKYRGYSYHQLGWAIVSRYFGHLEEISTVAKREGSALEGSERFFLYYGLSTFFYRIEKPEELERYLEWIKEFDIPFQPFFLEEVGYSWGATGGLLSEKIDYVENFVDRNDQPYLLEGLLSSLYPHSRMKPDRMLATVLKKMQGLSLQNRKVLAFSLGRLSWREAIDASLIEKLKRHRRLESHFSRELLLFYYQGVGGLLAENYVPFSGGWPPSFLRALRGIDPEWQEAVWWGAGFEAPLQYEDLYEFGKMAAGVPLNFRERFQKGLSDRFTSGGRNPWFKSEARGAPR